jgi:glycosyltransferase involved in cell wall biosynthesis
LETIDIYIHPSRTEGLSRAIIEAMSKACPVIASDVGGIKEQINGDLIYEKGNVEQICKIIRQTDNSIMKENATKNYENSQKYLADILTKRRIDFFNQFIEGK